jgi:hypothetical protein
MILLLIASFHKNDFLLVHSSCDDCIIPLTPGAVYIRPGIWLRIPTTYKYFLMQLLNKYVTSIFFNYSEKHFIC